MGRLRAWVLEQATRRRWFVAFGRFVMRPVDLAARWLGLSGRLGRPLSTAVANVPGAYLVTIGRRSGQPRTTPVVPVDGPWGVAVIASNFGQDRRPGWYHNLTADPDCLLERDGQRRPCRARPASAEERPAIWRRATAVYPAWETYDERTERELDVFVLEPRPGHEADRD